MNRFDTVGRTPRLAVRGWSGRPSATLAAVVAAFSPSVASACTVCMGAADSQTAGAINAAIFLMLGFIGSMLAALCAFAFYLMKRANSPLPAHLEFATLADGGED